MDKITRFILHLDGLAGKISILLTAVMTFIIVIATDSLAVSFKGTAFTIGQFYQDSLGTDYYNLAQGLRIHANDFGTDALSFHGYFQYYGNINDGSTAASDKFRFYHGYLQYSRMGLPLKIRMGRLFLFRGVGIGVLDGAEVTVKVNRRWSVTGYGGLQGPLSREWEFDRKGDSPMLGGEIRWLPDLFGVRISNFALSYTRQKRDGELLRNLLGLSMYFQINMKWSSLNTAHFNLSGSSLRKVITRWRYTSLKFHFSAEAGLIQPYSAAYSYFSDFESESYIYRFRNTVEYHFVPRSWGIGLSTLYFTTTEYGFRTGPYIIIPYGRMGYHHSWGNQPKNKVFWGQLKYSPKSYLDLYIFAVSMKYEWEAMNIETQETTMMNIGFALRPAVLKKTELGLEWQNYSTPQLKHDRRIIAKFRWNFDY